MSPLKGLCCCSGIVAGPVWAQSAAAAAGSTKLSAVLAGVKVSVAESCSASTSASYTHCQAISCVPQEAWQELVFGKQCRFDFVLASLKEQRFQHLHTPTSFGDQSALSPWG